MEVEESVVLHVKEEISNVEHFDFMRDKNIEKESIENQEKERLCIFGSISIISKEREHFESLKEKESEVEKKRGYDMTMDMHEFMEESSPRVKARRIIKMEINLNFLTSFGRTLFRAFNDFKLRSDQHEDCRTLLEVSKMCLTEDSIFNCKDDTFR
ncbi:hypothetical protein M9H77_07877 [Catharanthus roseus]|uniref:Uncharacterized protein n=1 Tax=Catharanthus roseus TaxID=4058 RepID=A0ACC0BW56_CATRO|nr:hypothetical protein M9H77_07877 [Catharanthus roseus]